MAREMMYSGSDWLKEIPFDWKIGKIQGLYSIRNTKVNDKDYEPLSVTKDGVLPQLESAAKTNAHDDRKLVRIGDFAINSRSDRRGSCGISDRDGSVSLINTILAPKGSMNPSYYNWLFHTTEFADEFYKWGHGIVDDLWTTNWQDMKKILIPSPTLQEQQKIASFLDSKCSQIDSLVANITKEIELLKEYRKSVIYEAVTKGLDPNVEMKDSGIEWIGMIPKNWNVCRVKDVCSEIGSGTTPASNRLDYYEDGDRFWIQSGDLYKNTLIESTKVKLTPKALVETKALKIYEKPFIVIAMYGASIGNHSLSLIDSCCNQACCCIKTDSSYSLEFLNYWLDTCNEDFLSNTAGGTQPNINQEKIKKQKVIVPKLNDQKRIVETLNKKCSQIDSLISDKQQQIDKLTEYKKSLIYEYVTGKKEVPAV